MKINKLENRILFTNIIITFKSTLVDSCRALHAKQAYVVCGVCVLVWRCPRAGHWPMGAGQSKAQWAPMNIGPGAAAAAQ